MNEAFGGPGGTPTWTTGAKTGVGTSVSLTSRVWFTLSQGILNEVYYPQIDTANIKDAQFLVSAEHFFSQEKTETHHEMERLDPWAPAFRLINTCLSKRYRITKEIITDPSRQVLLQKVKFTPLIGTIADYTLYALISPQIANVGFHNHAWTGEYNGIPLIYASRESTYLAVMCSTQFSKRSVGFEGSSDGFQDISQHHQMAWMFESASDGNVALTGQINLPANGEFTLAFGFGGTPEEAAQQAYESILKGFAACLTEYVQEWRERTAKMRDLSSFTGDNGALFRSSIQVFLCHQDKLFQGGTVASLAYPWGNAQVADGNAGGYHLVWPRDLVETATAKLALDDVEGAKQTLLYLAGIQQASGGWHQNNWLDGRPFWDSVQLDETAFPIMLAWRLHHLDALGEYDPWPMVHKAAAFLVQTGPVTQEERWEEDGGYSPSTLAVAISALICAADMALSRGERSLADYLTYVADWWASNLDAWTYTSNSLLDPALPAHYERLNTSVVSDPDNSDPNHGVIPIRNLSPDTESEFPARDVIDAGFLQLVYYGVRPPHDPHILASIEVVDKVLKEELPAGPSWHRYNHDGYGEHPDGDPFLGWGVGQAWPLLTGERAHYELAAGHIEEAQRLARALEGFAGEHKLLPEQVWTLDDIPEKGLFRGEPSGSAMPLVWAHAEYIKLLRSLADEQVFDLIPIVASRYKDGPPALRNVWRFNHKVYSAKRGEPIRIEVRAKAIVHWSADQWQHADDANMCDSGLGLYYWDIPISAIKDSSIIEFTFYWTDAQRWEGGNFTIQIQSLSE